MSIQPNKRYRGTVAPGSKLYESTNGTPGFQVMLKCEDGDTDFTIWLTEKNKKNAVKYFSVLGIPEEKLSSPSYLDLQLGMDIEGKEVVFEAKDEEYKGKHTIKVSFIGKPPSVSLVKDVAKLFGGNGQPEPAKARPVTKEDPIDNSDVPF